MANTIAVQSVTPYCPCCLAALGTPENFAERVNECANPSLWVAVKCPMCPWEGSARFFEPQNSRKGKVR